MRPIPPVTSRPAPVRRLVATLVALLLVVVVVPGCRSFPARRSSFAPGKVLVLPTRDVVQDGGPHELGAGSGQRFDDVMVRRLSGGGFTTVTTSAAAFSHTAEASPSAALAEGRRLGADLVLQAALGEFRNAAPATFRSDFVTLASATLTSTASGEVVWRLTKPVVLEKSNIGNHLGLIDKLAEQTAQSIRSR